MNIQYLKANSRDDLSKLVIHLTKDIDGTDSYDILIKIIRDLNINASKHYAIINVNPEGAACFYDVPLWNLQQLIETNPNNRKGYGILIEKNCFWYLGGRPVIYTDNLYLNWPQSQKFRLVNTEPNSIPPIDWTHECEWRTKGDLKLYNQVLANNAITWWWPCVKLKTDAKDLFSKIHSINSIYVIESEALLDRNLKKTNR
jgi:hypothetical protein